MSRVRVAIVSPRVTSLNLYIFAVASALVMTWRTVPAQVLIGENLTMEGGIQERLTARALSTTNVSAATLYNYKEEMPSLAPALMPVEGDAWLGFQRALGRGSSGWQYLDTEDGPATGDWIQPDFDASKWKKGRAPLGYGESTIATTLLFGDEENKYPAAFFRLSFELEKPAHATWVMRAQVDDGAVFYLNGQEIQRVRMPEGDIKNTTRPTTKTGSSSGLEGKFVTFEIAPDSLKNGKNVLCVSVHQADADSSDLVLDVEIIGLPATTFAAIEKQESQRKAELEVAKKAAAPPAQVAIRAPQPASLMTIFDSRIKPERTRLEHMLRSLPGMMELSKDQVEELVLAVGDAYRRLRASVKERAEQGDQLNQNLIRNEIYQGKISLTTDDGLIETFAAILTPPQLKTYSKVIQVREDKKMQATLEMFYANLNCGLFFKDDQRPEMLNLLKEIAEDPKTARSYSSSSNPISTYYQIQNGFTRAVREKDPRIAKILSAQQMKTLNDGVSTGSIYGGKFIKIDRVLAPMEK